jgi:uncharacterized protein (DUF1330 family)
MTYVIVTVHEIRDPDMLADYAHKVQPIVQRYGGEYLAIENAADAKEGSWPYRLTVLIAFPTAERARSWYNSPEYREIIGLRQDAIDADLVFVRGVGDNTAATVQ